MLYLLRPIRAGAVQRSREDASKMLSHALVDHWEYCNIFTIDHRYVAKKILDLYNKFYNIKRKDKKSKPLWYAILDCRVTNEIGTHMMYW